MEISTLQKDVRDHNACARGRLAFATLVSYIVNPSQAAFGMNTALLIIHGLIGVALLGAITHQAFSLVWRGARHRVAANLSFTERYAGVNQPSFTRAVIVLYLANVVLGGIIYPYYRLNVRIPFEEMRLGWAVGVFELKEHFAGIGLGMLPLYALAWRPESAQGYRSIRLGLTLLLAFVVWWDFLIGHVLNNIRGFE